MRSAFLFALALFLWLGAPAVFATDPMVRATLEALIERHPAQLDGTDIFEPRLLDAFYRERQDALAWTRADQLLGLSRLVEGSVQEGFSPDDFHGALLRALELNPDSLLNAPPVARVSLDLLLSDALLRYLHHSRYGKLDPVMLDARHHDRAPLPVEPLLAELRAALGAEDLEDAVRARFTPPFWYRRLREALADYAAMSHLAELPPLPEGPSLTLGSRDARVALVRERLGVINGEPPALDDARPFDAELTAAVRDFQRRYGLGVDGVVGPATLAALNRPFDTARIEQILINLERMRWFYQDLPEDYLFVDLAAFRVDLIHRDAVVWSTRAIVGSPEDPTPMFRDDLEHLVFNPTWTVPVSIQKTMGEVSSEQYLLVDRRSGVRLAGGDASDVSRYQLVQKPGPKNALGQVKFIFPNRHAIYLHDTPARHLFGRERRAFSHGCVRVDEPLALAERLLDGTAWNAERIASVVERAQTRYVQLAEPVPVLLYYLTASTDAQGRLEFRADLYGRDPALREVFAQPARAGSIRFAEPAEGEGMSRPAPEVQARLTQLSPLEAAQ